MRRLLPPMLAAAVALLCAATAAAQGPAPCVPQTESPLCTFSVAGVTHVVDGDTLDVDLADDADATVFRVRITGIQAMEQSVYSRDPARRQGDCHALEATARLEELVAGSGGIVRLADQVPDSRSRGRLLRSVQVLVAGEWEDVGRILVSEGHVLPMASRTEWAWNRTYSFLAQQAAHAGVGLWSTEYCGGGPPAALRLWVHWDAEAGNPSDEWVRIHNLDTAPVSLGGWWLRDSGLRRFTFPPETLLGAGATITVRVGTATGADLGWNLLGSVFDNVSSDERALGDGAFLFDPQGDLRTWMLYPCRDACTDPRRGSFELRAQATGRETVSLHNVGDEPIDLEGYALTAGGRAYAFAQDAVVGPDETLRVRIAGSPAEDTRLEKHWGRSDALLRDAGGAARLSTFDGIVLACDAWGGGAC